MGRRTFVDAQCDCDDGVFIKPPKQTHRPVPLPPPNRREKRAEAITRANKSEAQRENDLRQFVLVIQGRDKEIDDLEKIIHDTRDEMSRHESVVRGLRSTIAASTNASAIQDIKTHLAKAESEMRLLRFTMDLVKP